MAGGPNGEAEGADVDAARFNSAFLAGAAGQQLDLSVFSRGNPVIAGNYRVDVYVNDSWKGRRDLDFQADGDGQAHACLSLPVLEELGVDTAAVLESVPAEGESCRVIDDWIEGARARFDSAQLRYELSVPQAFLRHAPRGYVSPALWDTGINAAYVGYHFNAIDSRNRMGGGWSNNRTAYLGLNSGLNIGGWQLRHDASLVGPHVRPSARRGPGRAAATGTASRPTSSARWPRCAGC